MAPELVAPWDGMQGGSPYSIFWWRETPESEQYRLQISTDSNFTEVVYDEPGITGHMVGYSGLMLSTIYYWRVCAVNIEGEGPWSQAWIFSTGEGSSPLPLEGTWSFIAGQYDPVGLAYFPFWIEVWGEAIVGFGGGHFQFEGYRGFSRFGEVEDTTYFDYVVEEGSYTLEGSSINIVIPSLWDSLMVGLTTAQYEITGDTLILSYGPGWCGSWDQYYMEGQLAFIRN
jgi:hypothetical protein